jgi:cation transport ATPase
VTEAKRRMPTLTAADFEALAGRGAQARVSGKSVIIGGPRLLTEGKVTVPTEVEGSTTTWRPKEGRFSTS